MLAHSFKPKACDICGKSFIPMKAMQRVCGLACAKKVPKVLKAKASKELRARKEALKRIPDYIKETQIAFNAFIRYRDRETTCICCGEPLGVGEVGGAYDCGHYRSRGSAPHLRFDERNAHAQRKRCNRFGAGRAVDYRAGLIVRIGLAAVQELEADNRIHKWTREELIEIRDLYRKKLKELKSGQAS